MLKFFSVTSNSFACWSNSCNFY